MPNPWKIKKAHILSRLMSNWFLIIFKIYFSLSFVLYIMNIKQININCKIGSKKTKLSNTISDVLLQIENLIVTKAKKCQKNRIIKIENNSNSWRMYTLYYKHIIDNRNELMDRSAIIHSPGQMWTEYLQLKKNKKQTRID